MPPDDQLLKNIAGIEERIAAACARVGRSSDTVRLIAVTKYAEPAWVRGLLRLGLNTLGESRPQQLVERADQLEGEIEWHLIGHLQRNKVRSVLPSVSLIHSVDSAALLERIDRISGELGLVANVLLQVNVSGESSKAGFAPAELEREYAQFIGLEHVELSGLMTMAPLSDDPESARPTFRGLRELRGRLLETVSGGPALEELSMGMSHDFEVAIEEGATSIRIGSLLYEGLASSDEN